MSVYPKLDKVAISVKAHKVLGQFLRENPVLEEIIKRSASEAEAITGVREWVMAELERRPDSCRFYRNEAWATRLSHAWNGKITPSSASLTTSTMPEKHTPIPT